MATTTWDFIYWCYNNFLLFIKKNNNNNTTHAKVFIQNYMRD